MPPCGDFGAILLLLADIVTVKLPNNSLIILYSANGGVGVKIPPGHYFLCHFVTIGSKRKPFGVFS